MNLEATAQSQLKVKIPPELNDAYIMQRLGWTYQELRQTPQYLIEQIQLIWHLETVAERAAEKRARKGS